MIVDDPNTTQINAAALEAIDGVGTDTVVAAADQLTSVIVESNPITKLGRLNIKRLFYDCAIVFYPKCINNFNRRTERVSH